MAQGARGNDSSDSDTAADDLGPSLAHYVDSTADSMPPESPRAASQQSPASVSPHDITDKQTLS
eukprot:scaffold57727_cov32-Prasinocladus_malaysianus.AAC.2